MGCGRDVKHHVPKGYTADILIKWGGQHFDDSAPNFDPYRQSEADQLARFGYNDDCIGFVLPMMIQAGAAVCYSRRHLGAIDVAQYR